MKELLIREVREGDDAARREIIEAATAELRNTYRPDGNAVRCTGTPVDVLVALKNNIVVGTTEYIRKDRQLYVQGVAVHPDYRSRGVCRALLLSIEEIAKAKKLAAVALCVIEETGNAEIFKNLGFKVTNRAIAQNYVSRSGGRVTQLRMERYVA
jgi:N-acetylglutamate synthase-like GNAT family acetyltransferase